jgi:predicted GIY-YIG superfamily endonuclease
VGTKLAHYLDLPSDWRHPDGWYPRGWKVVDRYVYAIMDIASENSNLVYIGETENLKRRRRQHFRREVISKILSNNGIPVFFMLECMKTLDTTFRNQYWAISADGMACAQPESIWINVAINHNVPLMKSNQYHKNIDNWHTTDEVVKRTRKMIQSRHWPENVEAILVKPDGDEKTIKLAYFGRTFNYRKC